MALIVEPRVRETSNVVGTGNIVLTGRMYGSLSFDDVMNASDTSYVVISYQDSFEECPVTFDGTNLVRGTPIRSRHSDGTVDQTHVSFPAGIKTVYMVYPSSGIVDLNNNVVKYTAQSRTSGEQDQVRTNINALRDMASGTIQLFGAASPPVGWTKLTDHDDKALRIVSGTPSSGGVLGFASCFSRTATDSFTLLTTHLPAINVGVNNQDHVHIVTVHADNITFGNAGGLTTLQVFNSGTGTPFNTSGVSAPHDHTLGGSGTAFTIGMDMRTKYVDMIRAQKA